MSDFHEITATKKDATATTEDSSGVQTNGGATSDHTILVTPTKRSGGATSDDLLALAQRHRFRAAFHYEGCEADHGWCLVAKLADEVERLNEEREGLIEKVRRASDWANAEEADNDVVTAQRDSALAKVERLKKLVKALTVVIGQVEEFRVDADGLDDTAETEIDRVMVERDAAQAEVERLKNAIDHLTSEREARDEVGRLKTEVKRLTTERDEARARVHWFKADLTEATTKIKRVIDERDEARDERDAVQRERERLTAERDSALAEVERSKDKDWLEVAAQVADHMGAKARTDDGKLTADKIARRLRAMMMEEGR